jgi:penicillin-binding protein 1B
VAVVWVGRDDNKSSGLTGSTGALTVWGEMMKSMQPEALQPGLPEDVVLVPVDPVAGLSHEEACRTSTVLPFIKGSAPADAMPCNPSDLLPASQDASSARGDNAAGQDPSTERSWFRRLFD